MFNFTYNQLIHATKSVVWSSERKAKKVADPLHMNLLFGRGTVNLDEIEHLHAVSLEGYSVSAACGFGLL